MRAPPSVFDRQTFFVGPMMKRPSGVKVGQPEKTALMPSSFTLG
jgi:hypothetical protein